MFKNSICVCYWTFHKGDGYHIFISIPSVSTLCNLKFDIFIFTPKQILDVSYLKNKNTKKCQKTRKFVTPVQNLFHNSLIFKNITKPAVSQWVSAIEQQDRQSSFFFYYLKASQFGEIFEILLRVFCNLKRWMVTSSGVNING